MAVQREWFDKDYYKVLGVAENVSEKDLTRAYRKLAKQFHPDANPGAEDRFKEISAAYEVLGDPAKRKEYDEVRKMGPGAGAFSGFGGPGGFNPGAGGATFRMDDAGDLGDLLGGLFGRGRRRPRGPQRGGDLETRLTLSFDEAVDGVTTTVHVPGQQGCQQCHGSGAQPGTATRPCARCGGSGTLNDNQGMFSLSQICPQCTGRGVVVEHPCDRCHGSGRELSDRRVKVRIPAGVEDGQRIKVKGKGAPGEGNGPAGDLYVVVGVQPHHLFGRRGRNLTLTVPITYAEAVLGTQVEVPTLHDSVTVKVPAGTQPGTTLRVRGRGVPAAKAGAAPGDLLVRIELRVPKAPEAEELAAVEALRAYDDPQLRADLGGVA